MNHAETAMMLAKAAAFDQRTVGRADVAAWAEALYDVPADIALAAVTRHYRAEPERRLMPAHVIQLAEEITRERRRAEREAAEARQQLAGPPRRERSAETYALIAQLRATLPDVPNVLRRPEVVAWEQTRDRQHRAAEYAEPNPAYDPAAMSRAAKLDYEAAEATARHDEIVARRAAQIRAEAEAEDNYGADARARELAEFEQADQAERTAQAAAEHAQLVRDVAAARAAMTPDEVTP